MPIKNQPHCLCYEFNYQINRNNFDRGIFLDAVDSIFLGGEMKILDVKIEGFFAVAVVIGIALIASLFLFDTSDISTMLETPVRDMKLGQVVGLIMFAWVLFS